MCRTGSHTRQQSSETPIHQQEHSKGIYGTRWYPDSVLPSRKPTERRAKERKLQSRRQSEGRRVTAGHKAQPIYSRSRADGGMSRWRDPDTSCLPAGGHCGLQARVAQADGEASVDSGDPSAPIPCRVKSSNRGRHTAKAGQLDERPDASWQWGGPLSGQYWALRWTRDLWVQPQVWALHKGQGGK